MCNVVCVSCAINYEKYVERGIDVINHLDLAAEIVAWMYLNKCVNSKHRHMIIQLSQVLVNGR